MYGSEISRVSSRPTQRWIDVNLFPFPTKGSGAAPNGPDRLRVGLLAERDWPGSTPSVRIPLRVSPQARRVRSSICDAASGSVDIRQTGYRVNAAPSSGISMTAERGLPGQCPPDKYPRNRRMVRRSSSTEIRWEVVPEDRLLRAPIARGERHSRPYEVPAGVMSSRLTSHPSSLRQNNRSALAPGRQDGESRTFVAETTLTARSERFDEQVSR